PHGRTRRGRTGPDACHARDAQQLAVKTERRYKQKAGRDSSFLYYRNRMVMKLEGSSPLAALTALTIGSTNPRIPTPRSPNRPRPRTKIPGIQIRMYNSRLNCRLITALPWRSIPSTVFLVTAQRIRGAINPPNPRA